MIEMGLRDKQFAAKTLEIFLRWPKWNSLAGELSRRKSQQFYALLAKPTQIHIYFLFLQFDTSKQLRSTQTNLLSRANATCDAKFVPPGSARFGAKLAELRKRQF